MLGELRKLKVEAYTSLQYDQKAAEFEVMFNPASYAQKYEVEYHAAQGQGTSGSSLKYGRIMPREYTFELFFDGTGVAADKRDVSHDIEEFLTVTGKHQGDLHRPYYLKLSWGSLLSKCVLKGAEITYTLFRPDGFPLRAKVSAVFSENIEDTLREREENNGSPDLTHERVVKDGEALPLLVYRTYGDSTYYTDVARSNGLAHFRKLAAGLRLRLPPLVKGAR